MTGRLSRVWAAVQDALSTRVARPGLTDRSYRSPLPWLTPEAIGSALSICQNGDCRQIGDIYDAIPASDPHVYGVRRQLRAGVTSLPFEITAVDDTPQAEAVAERVRAAVDRPEANWATLLEGIVEGQLRGAGLIETIWNEPAVGRERTWTGFSVVPQQRLRYDRDTGALLVITDPLAMALAVPVASFPSGKFVRVQVDTDVPDFSLRGGYRSIIADWYGRLNVGRWELTAIERYGMPVPVGFYDTAESLAVITNAFRNFGAAGALVVNKGAEVRMEAAPVSGSGALIHETYLEKSAERISVALLGSSQTATIGTDQGSKASADTHAGVRRDVLYALWQLIATVVRRDLFIPFVRLNFGETAVRLTPRIVTSFDETVDMLQTSQAIEAMRAFMDIPEGWARETLGVPSMGPGDVPLKRSVPAPSPFGAPATAFQAPAAAALPPAPVPALPEPATPPVAASAQTAKVLKRPLPQLVETAPEGALLEITAPLLSIVGGVKSPSDMRRVRHKIDSLPPTDAPKLTDDLAASIFDATLKGIQRAREQRTA